MAAPASSVDLTALSLVLGSSSPRRRELIARLGLEPARIAAAEIDETPHPREQPRPYAVRMAREKADAIDGGGAYVLAGDTVVALGRRILPKANLVDEAAQCLRMLSGRNHRVYTAICEDVTSMRRTQRGNNNPYCQDNEITWIDWLALTVSCSPSPPTCCACACACPKT